MFSFSGPWSLSFVVEITRVVDEGIEPPSSVRQTDVLPLNESTFLPPSSVLRPPSFFRVEPAGVEPATHRVSDGCLAARPQLENTIRLPPSFNQPGRRDSNPNFPGQSRARCLYNTPRVLSRRNGHPRKQDSVSRPSFLWAPTRPSTPCSPAPVYLACTLRGRNDSRPIGPFSASLSSSVLTFLRSGCPSGDGPGCSSRRDSPSLCFGPENDRGSGASRHQTPAC